VAVATACLLQSELRIEHRLTENIQIYEYSLPSYFRRSDGCVVMSFDGAWYPFPDSTRGYNRGPQRWYIPKMSQLIVRVALALQSPEQRRKSGRIPGGRVFLHADGVLRSGNVPLLRWKLEKKSIYLRPRTPATALTGT
jgi:hypothetical protein